ncbi:EF-hand domain-containing protein [Aurantiacibacter gilvus]|uniref:EF-hand domain-containing protein n=1 Tax=Aurantiacibacter gilvus TaxID=3139141 RepID=A0ABU9IK03_9SPHN
MIKTLFLAAATSALLLGAPFAANPAAAQDRPQRGADITRADAEARAASAFARMDANGDGLLDAADREARAHARFARMDADGNGQVSFEEMQAARETRREAMQERRGEAGERRGRRGAQRMAMRGAGPHMMGQRLQQADTDGDNAVSQAEFTAAALARFDRADTNNDGTVTAEERRAQHAEHRGRMGDRRGANR